MGRESSANRLSSVSASNKSVQHSYSCGRRSRARLLCRLRGRDHLRAMNATKNSDADYGGAGRFWFPLANLVSVRFAWRGVRRCMERARCVAPRRRRATTSCFSRADRDGISTGRDSTRCSPRDSSSMRPAALRSRRASATRVTSRSITSSASADSSRMIRMAIRARSSKYSRTDCGTARRFPVSVALSRA